MVSGLPPKKHNNPIIFLNWKRNKFDSRCQLLLNRNQAKHNYGSAKFKGFRFLEMRQNRFRIPTKNEDMIHKMDVMMIPKATMCMA